MKATIGAAIAIVLLFLLVIPFEIGAQALVKRKAPGTEKEMLCHKWNLSNSNNPFKILSGTTYSTIKFLPAGCVVFTAGKQVQGIWKYDEAGNNLFIIVNNKLWKYKVLALTNQQLVLESSKNKSTIKNVLCRSNL